MENQPQNPEFRINPETFSHAQIMDFVWAFHPGLHILLRSEQSSWTEIHHCLKIVTFDPLKYIMDNPMLIAFICMEKYLFVCLI